MVKTMKKTYIKFLKDYTSKPMYASKHAKKEFNTVASTTIYNCIEELASNLKKDNVVKCDRKITITHKNGIIISDYHKDYNNVSELLKDLSDVHQIHLGLDQIQYVVTEVTDDYRIIVL